MNSALQRIKDIMPLTPLEKAFKYLYTSGLSYTELREPPPQVTEILRDHPADQAEFWTIKEVELGNVLDEHLFFDEEADIFINIHPRYMPAPPHTHHFFELQYVLAGSFTQSIADTTLKMGTGDVCFIAPGTEHLPIVYDDCTLLVNILIRKTLFGRLSSTY